MEEFTYIEKLAVVWILNEILKADNITDDKEVRYLNDVILSFQLKESQKEEALTFQDTKVTAVVQSMSAGKKSRVAQMMGKMIVIDNDINYNEVKLYNDFCRSCQIEDSFNIEDFPECTLSGPFTNPEDI